MSLISLIFKSFRKIVYIATVGANNLCARCLFIPNRSLEKVSCHFLMTAIRKTALYMLDS